MDGNADFIMSSGNTYANHLDLDRCPNIKAMLMKNKKRFLSTRTMNTPPNSEMKNEAFNS